MSFPEIGLQRRNSRRIDTILPSTISASRPVSRYRFGVKKDGSTPTIRGAGFSGIVAITLGAVYMGKMHGRSDDGRRCSVIFASFKRIANPAIYVVDDGNDKRCSSGRMTVEKSKARIKPVSIIPKPTAARRAGLVLSAIAKRAILVLTNHTFGGDARHV
jgi:hypothetical protein